MRQHTSLFIMLVVAAALTTPLTAQQGSSFGESVDVNVVNVDVLISDRQGNPVTGLGKAAFQLKEDNNKIKIDGFSEDGTAAALFPSIVVYVDDTHVFKAGRDAALDAVSPYILERIKAGDSAVMVARFDGFTEVLQGFTTDADAIRSAIEAIKQQEPNPSESMLMEREAVRMMQDSQSRNSAGRAMDSLRAYGQILSADTTRSLNAMTELAGSLGHRSGRKAFYVIADGLAMRPMGLMMDNMQRRAQRSGGAAIATGADASEDEGLTAGGVDFSQGDGGTTGLSGIDRLQRNTDGTAATPAFEILAGVANSSKIMLYPIRPPVVDAASAGLGNQATEKERGVTDLREGPQMLADSTGGLAFVTGSDVAGFLQNSNELGTSMYSLAYTPDKHPEGSLHALNLKVKGKGLRVRYRQSYVMKNASAQLADRAVGAATLGWIENPHGIETKIDEQAQAEDGTWNVTILLTIPIAELGLVEANGIHQTNCRVAILVVTERGGMTRPQFMDIPLQITEAQLEDARSQVFGAKANLRIPAGTHQIAVAMWDEIGGKGSYIAAPIEIGG